VLHQAPRTSLMLSSIEKVHSTRTCLMPVCMYFLPLEPVEERGLIVVVVVGCGNATWSPDENRKRRPWMKAMGILNGGALSTTEDLIGIDLRENALYGFALRRSWSTVSGRTLPGSLSFHMRAVLEAAPKTKSRDYIFNLCHEVIVALFMNNPLRIPPIGSMSMSNIFDGYLEMVRH
jgi:hypothetical protein